MSSQKPQTKAAVTRPRPDVAAFEALAQALVGITAESLAGLGAEVTAPQFRLLRTLETLGRVSSSTPAAALGTAPSSVTRLVDRLQAAGLVVRGTDARSRSIVTVEVTAAGRVLVADVTGRRRALLEQVLDAMSPPGAGPGRRGRRALRRLGALPAGGGGHVMAPAGARRRARGCEPPAGSLQSSA